MKNLFLLLPFLLLFGTAFSQTEPRLVLPVGHTAPITSAIFSPNGELVFTTSSNYQTKVYNVKTGKEITQLNGRIIEFLNDRRHILMFGNNNKYLLVDNENFTTKFSYVLNGGYHSLFAFLQTEFFNKNKYLSGNISYNSDSTQLLINSLSNFILYDLKADKEILNIKLFDDYKQTIKFGDFKEYHIPRKQYISHISFQNNNEILVETSNDSTQVWDIKSKKIIRLEKSLTNHVQENKLFEKEMNNLNRELKSNFNYNKKEQIAVWTNRWNNQDSSIGIDEITNYSSGENYLVLKNNQTGEIIKKLNGHNKRINAFIFDNIGKYLAICSQDNTCRLWNLSDYTYKDLKYHSKEVSSASFSPDGKNIITVSADSSAVIWDTKTGKIQTVLAGFSLESKNSILTENYIINEIDNDVFVFHKMTGNIFEIIDNCSLLKFNLPLNDADKKEYNDCVFLQKDKNSFTIRNLKNRTEKSYKLYLPGNIEHYNFYVKNDTILYNDGFFNVYFWNKQEQELIHKIDYIKNKHNKNIEPIDYVHYVNKNLDFALVSSSKENIYSINTRSGKILKKFKRINYKKISFCTASTNDKIVIVNKSMMVNAHDVEIWDMKSDKKIWSYKTKNWLDGIQTVHLCKDDKEISIFDNNTIQFYDLNTGILIHEIPDIKGIVKIYNSPNQQYLVISESYANSAYLTLFDLDKHEILFKSKCHNGLIHNVSFDQNSNFFYSNSSDNSSVFWSIKDKTMLYRRILINGNNWIVHDKNYRYQGTPGAMDKIHYVCDLDVVELNQIKDSLYVPNLVQRIMNGENLDHLPKLSELNICGVTPVVEPLENDKSGNQGYRIIPRSGGVGDVDVYINGVVRLSTNAKNISSKDNNGNLLLYLDKELLDLYQIPGEETKVKVIAKTANNSISSRSVVIDIESDEKTTFKKPALHAIMIGVDDYKGDGLDLNYAAKDANDLQIVLQKSAQNYFNSQNDDTNRVYFYNLSSYKNDKKNSFNSITPDRGNILRILDTIKLKSKPEDIFLLFFAGHGEIVDKEQLMLLTAESSRDKYEGIRMRELLEEMNKIPATKRILILDACHSGAVFNELETKLIATNSNKERDINDAKIQSQRSKELDKLASKSGFAIMTASSSDQKALELPQYEHGLMTYALLNSMLNNPNALGEEGALQLEKWLMTTADEVSKLNSNQTAEPSVQRNYTIGIVDDVVRNLIQLQEIPTIFIKNVVNVDLSYDNLEIESKLNEYFANRARGGDKSLLLASVDQTNATLVNILYTKEKNAVNLKITILKNNQVHKQFTKTGTEAQLNDLIEEIALEIESGVK